MYTKTTKSSSFKFRHRAGNLILVIILAIITIQLFTLQVFKSAELNKEIVSQLKLAALNPALRGSIVDRNDHKMASTLEAKSLTFQPNLVHKQLTEAKSKFNKAPDPDRHLIEIAKEIASNLSNKPDFRTLLKRVNSNQNFVYLARAVYPEVANKIVKKFPEVGTERLTLRKYPNGSLAANIIGGTDWNGRGLLGLENSLDAVLSGSSGLATYNCGVDGVILPGSYYSKTRVVNGSNIKLTLDTDIQYYLQQQVQEAKEKSGANNVLAIVLDAKSSEILAMSNDNTFDPGQDIGRQENKQMGNLAISSPFEPGSVNKIIIASAAIEYNLSKPDEVLQVPNSINIGGITVNDAWSHSLVKYTTTGVFGKSSNVGTLMLAQRIGQDKFYSMLKHFGLGQSTNVGLPGESFGLVPSVDQWSSSSFSNLPIGQGLSVTLLQMAGMYQAIGNNGFRFPPNIINLIKTSNGININILRPAGTKVVSSETAFAVRDMFRSIVQHDPLGYQQGTGSQAGISGYQIAGKTGTAQQIDPRCSCYYNNIYWITFAGIVPENEPKYVIGIMIDAPQRTSDGFPGSSAAPMFHKIASWLLQHTNTPLFMKIESRLTLEKHLNEDSIN